MNLVIVAVVAIIASTIAVFVDRQLQLSKTRRKDDTREQDSVAEQTDAEAGDEEPIQQDFWSRFTNWRQRVTNSKQQRAEQFQAWAGVNVADPAIAHWIGDLSPEAIKALTTQLDDFCASLGFELDWLLDDTLAQDPEVATATTAVVQSYCTACWHAAQNYASFERFKVLQKLLQQPQTREYQDLNRRLFAELVKRDMTPGVPADLFVAAEKERQEHMASVIRANATENRAAFKQVLQAVMEPDSQPAPHAAPHDPAADGDAPAEHRPVNGAAATQQANGTAGHTTEYAVNG